MDSTIAAAAVGAGTALLSSYLTGRSAKRSTAATLEGDFARLEAQIEEDRTSARVNREQARYQETYVAMLRYVFWLQDTRQASREILARQNLAAESLIGEHTREGIDPDDVEKAFREADPTPEEQARIDAGPDHRDNLATLSSVTALSSDEVLELFEEMNAADEEFDRKNHQAMNALHQQLQPRPSATTDTAGYAKELISRAVNAHDAIFNAIKAGKKAERAMDELIKQARAELNPR